MTIKGELKLSIEMAIAKIEAEAQLELTTAEEKRFSDTKITIHGTLKKPIVALNLRDLMESLRDLVKNPDDYLSATPMYYRSVSKIFGSVFVSNSNNALVRHLLRFTETNKSCFPLSSIFNTAAINFQSELQNDQLGEIYQLKANFQNQLKQINTLSRFAHDITGVTIDASEDLPDVIDRLREIKQDFQFQFKGMQDSWIEIMGR